jgi:hypothetical protein
MTWLRSLVSGLFVLGAVAFAWVLLTHPPATADGAAQPESDLAEPVNCVGLSAPPWKGEVETTLDMHNGLLTIVYYRAGDSAETITVRYEDPSCRDNPNLHDLIEHVVTTANEDIASECADLKKRLATGNLTARGHTLDPAAVVAYIERWC